MKTNDRDVSATTSAPAKNAEAQKNSTSPKPSYEARMAAWDEDGITGTDQSRLALI